MQKESSFSIFIIFFLGFSSAEVSVNAHLLRRGSATWIVPPHSCHGSLLSGAALLSFVDASNRRRAGGCACNNGQLCANCCLVLPEGPPAALGNWGRDENLKKAERKKKWQPLLHNMPYMSLLHFTILISASKAMMESCPASEAAVDVLTPQNWCQGEKKDWNGEVPQWS